VQLRNIKRGAILRIVGLITAHSSPDIYLISLTMKIVNGYKSNYTESNKTISEKAENYYQICICYSSGSIGTHFTEYGVSVEIPARYRM
jgi:hypothetical protein